MDQQQNLKIQIEEARANERLVSDVKYIREKVDSIEKNIKQEYVTKAEHDIFVSKLALIQSIVFGFVSLILLGFGGAVVAFFIK